MSQPGFAVTMLENPIVFHHLHPSFVNPFWSALSDAALEDKHTPGHIRCFLSGPARDTETGEVIYLSSWAEVISPGSERPWSLIIAYPYSFRPQGDDREMIMVVAHSDDPEAIPSWYRVMFEQDWREREEGVPS